LPDNAPITYTPEGSVNYNETLLSHFNRMLPDFSGKQEALDYIRNWASGSQAGVLSISFILALFFASNGMMTLMRGFEKSYKSTFTSRNPIYKRLIAIYLTFIIGLLVMGSFFFILLSSPIIEYLQNLLGLERFGSKGINLLSVVLLICLLYTGISVVYRLAAPTLRKFQFFSTGATLATILSVLTTAGFSFYVNEFNTYNRLYSSIGTVIVIMLTIQFNCLILLIGYELNASIAVNVDLKKSLLRKKEEDEDKKEEQ
ncbi:MAG: YihY/virulence factor BrkB family protein, partial [Bacteroidota bacterium]